MSFVLDRYIFVALTKWHDGFLHFSTYVSDNDSTYDFGSTYHAPVHVLDSGQRESHLVGDVRFR